MSVGAVEPAPLDPHDDDRAGPDPSRQVAPAEERPLTVVNSDLRLGARIAAIWRHRQLLLLLTRSELKIKYKGSVLGYLWSMLNPALVLAIYFVAFTIIARGGGIPRFAIFLFAGLLAWNLFNNAAMSSTTVVVGKAGIVKKVAFPRELLALSTVGVALVLFAIQVVVLVIVMVAFGLTPDWTYLALMPLAIVALVLFTSAVSIFLSAVNVYLRDTQHLTEVLLMAWFWFTPIVYYWGLVSSLLAKHGMGWVKWIYLANPMAPIVLTFQRVIWGSDHFSSGGTTVLALPTVGITGYAALLGAVLVGSAVLFLLALVAFGRLEGNFAEEL